MSAWLGLSEERRVYKQQWIPPWSPPRDYKSPAADCQGKAGPSAPWASAQPEAAVCLAPVSSQHSRTCSWGLRVLWGSWQGLGARPPPALPEPCARQLRSSSLPCTQEGISHSCLHLAAGHTWDVSCTALIKVSHPAGASNEVRSIPFAPADPRFRNGGCLLDCLRGIWFYSHFKSCLRLLFSGLGVL